MERPITDLMNKHSGMDVYVIASGASAGYIEPSFFDNKISVGVNETYHRFPNQSYIVRKDFARATEAYTSGIPLVISRFDCGSLRKFTQLSLPRDESDYYVFDHEHNGRTEVDLSVIGTDKLVVSYSTITTAMHLAAYMGAANIIVVGHDVGMIDGDANIPEYHAPSGGTLAYTNFLGIIEPQTIAVRDRIKEVFGCNVYSLNPWINLGLEGHRYEPAIPESSATGDVSGDVYFRRLKLERQRNGNQ